MESCFANYQIDEKKENEINQKNNFSLLDLFISSKRVEGCSDKSLKYYQYNLKLIFNNINKNILYITSDNVRSFLDRYQKKSSVSKVTVNNIRRILSSFFAWLENEDYIIKNPVRKIHKIRTGKIVKETISDENIEKLRDNTVNIRDLSIIDLLISSGIRVGELV